MNREELIELCERAIVDEGKWKNRDSHYSQLNIGKAWALLKAGCVLRLMMKNFARIG